MTTVISHIFNEEFLLPHWIKHHIQEFDDGIIIDFDSTDASLDIVSDLAPHWKIIKSPLKFFEADKVDRLIESIEESIIGPRICLNTTEFLIGDSRRISRQVIVPQISLINLTSDPEFNIDEPFHTQRKHGLFPDANLIFQDSRFPIFSGASGRSIHNHPVRYPLGRHFEISNSTEMLIYRVSDCFVAPEMYERRLQIQSKVPPAENLLGRGRHHTNNGQGLKLHYLKSLEEIARGYSVNLGPLLDQALFMKEYSTKVRTFQALSPKDHERAWRYTNSNFQVDGLLDGLPIFRILSEYAAIEISRLRQAYESSLSWRVTRYLRLIRRAIIARRLNKA